MLSRRQARWAEILSPYDFVIEHLEGKKNPADGPSGGPDNEIGYKGPIAQLLATLAATTVEQYDDLLQKIKTAQAIDALAADLGHRILGTPLVDIPDLRRIDELEEESRSEWKVTAGDLTYEGSIYVPKDDLLRNKVISHFNDKPGSGHFGAPKTAELMPQDFHWSALDATIQQYIAGWELCHRTKAPWHATHGTNMPLARTSQPWEGVTIDFVTDLPESTASGYRGSFVIVDRLTQMAIYLPGKKDID